MTVVHLNRKPSNWDAILPELLALGFTYSKPNEINRPEGWGWCCCKCMKKDQLLNSPDNKIFVKIGGHDDDGYTIKIVRA